MAIAVGPLPGNGVVFHATDTIAIGFCVVKNGEIGDYISGQFNVGQGWIENAVLEILAGLQGRIDANYQGLLGNWYVSYFLPKVNNWSKGLIAVNPHPAVIHNEDKFTDAQGNDHPEIIGELIYEYTEGYLDSAGEPQWRVKPYNG